MNAEHEHVTVNLHAPPPPPPYYTHSTADTWHPTLVPKNSGSPYIVRDMPWPSGYDAHAWSVLLIPISGMAVFDASATKRRGPLELFSKAREFYPDSWLPFRYSMAYSYSTDI